jgi:hypothetical protein
MSRAPETVSGTAADTAIHLSLQGKGGVGKSLVAAILAQYFRSIGRQVRCIDTDPVNQTFASYRALGADHLELLQNGTIEQRRFDQLMERFLTEERTTFVVDSGASTFLPLWHYLLENEALEYLRREGRRVYVHTVITGGQALLDTLTGFTELAKSSGERNIIVWVNEYFGRVEADGKSFSEMAAYRDNTDKVCGIVVLKRRNPDTFGRDLEEMIRQKLTFEEAIVTSALPIMSKQRLKMMEREIFEQLEKASL